MQKLASIMWDKNVEKNSAASALGIPLYMDNITTSKNRLVFAKVCVEVEADKVLPNYVNVELKDGSMASIRVEVPWMPSRCFHCKIFGHHNRVCPQQPVKPRVLEVKWVPKRFVLEKVVPRVSTVASSGSEVNPVGSVEVSVNEGLTKKGKSFIPASANRFDVLNSMEQQYVASTSVQGGLFLFREVTLLM
ncbi:hypothetical protein V6N13_091073 [Hibiscus sabdariffa]